MLSENNALLKYQLKFWREGIKLTINQALELVPKDKLNWAPADKMITLGNIFLHISECSDWWYEDVMKGNSATELAKDPCPTKDKIAGYLEVHWKRLERLFAESPQVLDNCLAEVVMALKHIEKIDLGIDTRKLRAISIYVADGARRPMPVSKAITGDNIFAHESGIHADGVLKHPGTYEAFTPEEVGSERQIMVGKHSGSHTIHFKFANEFGIEIPDELAREILARSRALAVKRKRALFGKELALIYRDVCEERSLDLPPLEIAGQ